MRVLIDKGYWQQPVSPLVRARIFDYVVFARRPLFLEDGSIYLSSYRGEARFYTNASGKFMIRFGSGFDQPEGGLVDCEVGEPENNEELSRLQDAAERGFLGKRILARYTAEEREAHAEGKKCRNGMPLIDEVDP